MQLELPTDQPDARQVLAVVKRRMGRIKNGHEAGVAFRLQEAISGLSRDVYEASVDLFANRTVGTLTNVPVRPSRSISRAAGSKRWPAGHPCRATSR